MIDVEIPHLEFSWNQSTVTNTAALADFSVDRGALTLKSPAGVNVGNSACCPMRRIKVSFTISEIRTKSSRWSLAEDLVAEADSRIA